MRTWMIYILLLAPIVLLANDEINASYAAGLRSYQESNYEQAKEHFLKALADEPENPLINYNVGITEWKLGSTGKSLAMLRRAQYFDPGFARAFDAERFLKENLKLKALPHKITAWESFRTHVLKLLSLDGVFAVFTLLFAFTAYNVPKFLGRWRASKENESEPPNAMVTVILSALTIVVGAFLVLKLYDNNIERGTIVNPSVEAKASPDESSASLFELFDGLEVVVRRSQLDSNQRRWFQVYYPGGMTGWIPSDTMISHSAKNIL